MRSRPGFGSGSGSGSGGDVIGASTGIGAGAGAGGPIDGVSGFGGPLSSTSGGGGAVASGSSVNLGSTTTSTSDSTLPSGRFNNDNVKDGVLKGGKDAMDLVGGGGGGVSSISDGTAAGASKLAGLGVNVGMGSSSEPAVGDASTTVSTSSGVMGKTIGQTGGGPGPVPVPVPVPEPSAGTGTSANTGVTAPKVEDDEEL